ncbi:MAG: hypothetical protein ACLGJB_04300 [Blastocatellia bacterium]
MNEQPGGILGIRRIIFRAGGGECPAVVRKGGRVDGMEYGEVLLQQCKDERAAALPEAGSYFPPAKAKAHRSGPLSESLWSVFDDGELFVTRSSIPEQRACFLSAQSKPTKAAYSHIISSRNERIGAG